MIRYPPEMGMFVLLRRNFRHDIVEPVRNRFRLSLSAVFLKHHHYGGSILKILIIDGQGGGLGKLLVEELKKEKDLEIMAVGTNSTAAAAMKKAGAKQAAAGENSVIVACRKADIIIGAVGIAIADSLLGEITPAMAAAVGQSNAVKILIPVNKCDILIAGCEPKPVAFFVRNAAERVRELLLSR